MIEIKRLNEEVAGLKTELKNLLDKANSEKRGLNAEEEQKFDQLYDQVEANKKKIDQLRKVEAIEFEQSDKFEEAAEKTRGKKSPEQLRTLSNDWFRSMLMKKTPTAEQWEAYNMTLPKEERAAQQSTTTTAGGYTIPEGFSNQLEKALEYYGPMRSVSRIIKTASGNDMPWPYVDDTSNHNTAKTAEAGNLETATGGGSATAVTFGVKTLKAYKFDSNLIRYSYEIMQDSYFDFGQVIADLCGERLGRTLNYMYTLGAGTTTVEGVTIGATLGVDGESKTAFTSDKIIDLLYSVDRAYRNRQSPNVGFMLNDGSLKYIAKLTVGTSDDRLLWYPSMRDGEPEKLLGYNVFPNNDMATIANNAKTILFGDFNHYVIRDVGNFRVRFLGERFADTDEYGLVVLHRTDGMVIDAGKGAIKYLMHWNT